MAMTHDYTRLIVYGGYSKERVKRDVDRGQIHSDMFALTFDSQSVVFYYDEQLYCCICLVCLCIPSLLASGMVSGTFYVLGLPCGNHGK